MPLDIDKIRDIWQPASPRPLSGEDCREIAANVVGFLQLLDRWDQQDRALGETESGSQPATPAPRPRRPA